MSASSSSLFANPATAGEPGLYDRAVAILRERYYDRSFRETKLNALAAEFRPVAPAKKDLNAERRCLTNLLAQVPASHLSVLSEESFHYLIAELSGEPRPTFGLQALKMDDSYFTFFVLEGGPAANAGIVPWERIVSIDGRPIAQSERLDYPQKDAYLPIDRDPPIHSILCREGEGITLILERTAGQARTIKLTAGPYSALEAARTSAHIIKLHGRRLAYLHFWFIHSKGVLELLRELFDGPLAGAEGLVLDLRGRGGNGVIVDQLLQILGEWRRPIVALIDRQSRSAKEALSFEFKRRRLATLVGERTAGAVIPASFAPIGEKTILMFPSFTLGKYTKELELKGGVEPDVAVERAGPYSAGKDPILERGTSELLRLVANSAPVKVKKAKLVSSPSPTAPVASNRALPSLDSLITKMVDSLGGEQTLRAQAHRTLSGKTELVGLPMKGAFLQKASAPDKSLVVMNLGDLQIKQGYDGTTAWTETSMNGLQILSGSMAEAVKQQAKFYGPLDLPTSDQKITVTGYVSFDGKDCIELKLVSVGGATSNLYVDAVSFLIAGSKAQIETPIGTVESKTNFRNYQSLGGYLTATEIFIESSVQRQMIRIEHVNFDPLAESEYAPPQSTR